MRWRREDRQAPDEPRDEDAEGWLSEFRPVRPDALTAADRDAAGQAVAADTRARFSESAEPPARREDRRVRPASGGVSQPEPGNRRPAALPPVSPRSDLPPVSPRSDLERDVGPWAGLRPSSASESDRRDTRRADAPGRLAPHERARRPDRQPAEEPDTDRFRTPVRDHENPPAGLAPADRRDYRPADRRDPAAERRAPNGFPPGRGLGERTVQPDHGGPPPAHDGSSRGYDGRPGRPAGTDARRPGGDAVGHQRYWPESRNPSRGDAYGGRGPAGYVGDGPARPPVPPRGPGGPIEPRRRELPLPRDMARPDTVRPGTVHPGTVHPGTMRPDAAVRPGGGRPGTVRPDPERSGPAQPPWLDNRSVPMDRPPRPDGGPPGHGAAATLGPRRDATELPMHGQRSDHAVRPATPGPADQHGRPQLGVRPDSGSFPAPGHGPAAGYPRQRPQPAEPARAQRAEPLLPAPPEFTRPAGPVRQTAAESAGAREPETPARGAPGGRADLAANLTLADLARVREALALLSDDPAAGRADDPASSLAAPTSPALPAAGADDEADTFPLPVILPGVTAVPRPEPVEAPRGPFEPARPTQAAAAAEPEPPEPAPEPEPERADGLSPAAAEKLDQIKDLLITAEAIGEANLDRHFDQVSRRQRELIREFFEQAAPGREPPG